MSNFESLFAESEGDLYYERNREIYDKRGKEIQEDSIIQLLEKYQIKPNKVLDVGCSDGYRLNFIQNSLKAKVWGVDLSSQAIAVGKEKYPNVNLAVASASDLSIFEDQFFDLVYCSGLLFVIDRNLILKVYSEMDRVLTNGGYLLISALDSVFASKVKYSHIKESDLYTYKQDYSKPLTSLNTYFLVDQTSYCCSELMPSGTNNFQQRYTTWLLRKDLDGLYIVSQLNN